MIDHRAAFVSFEPAPALEPGEAFEQRLEFDPRVVVEGLVFSDEVLLGRDAELERHSSVGVMLSDLFGNRPVELTRISHNARRRALRERRRRLRLAPCLVVERLEIDDRSMLSAAIPCRVLALSLLDEISSFLSEVGTRFHVRVRNIGSWKSRAFFGGARVSTTICVTRS